MTDLSGITIPPLPNPSDVATRQREQAAALAQASGARLLYVSALDGAMVVLEEGDAGGWTTTVPWVGPYEPVVGEKWARITIPGRGSKHAAPTYFAIGPIRSSELPVPIATTGPAMGTSPGAVSVTGSDGSGTILQNPGTSTATGVLWTVTFATPKAIATYRPQLTNLSSTAADAVTYITARTATGFNIACRNAPGAAQMAVAWEIRGIE